MSAPRGEFSSKLGFLMAAAGSAVGLGNIVGFPTQVASNGGAAFLLVYLFLAWFIWIGQEMTGPAERNGSFIISLIIIPLYLILSQIGRNIISSVVDSLGISANQLHRWKGQFSYKEKDSDNAELIRLREEVKRLRMERDILKKATAFFANEKN